MSHDIIVSIHIPKTAGITFKNILTAVYGDSLLWFTETNSPRYAFERLRGYALEGRLKDIKCIHGHIGFGIHNYLNYMGVGCKYITFTRNIADRLLSYYNYIQTDAVKAHYKWENRFGWSDDISFTDWLSSCKMADQDNSMVRFLSGCDNLNTDPIKYRMSKQDLSMAIKNIRDLFFIGSVHNFDSDIKALASKLSWDSIPDYGRDNVSPTHRHYPDLSVDERNLIFETQPLDISLLREMGRITYL